MNWLKKQLRITKRLNSITGMIAGIGILCLAAITVFETVSRKVFNHPTIWSFDISKYLFLFVSFSAFTFTMQENGHIGFGFLIERVKGSPAWHKFLTIISGIFGTLFSFFLLYEAVILNTMAIKYNWMTRGLTRIPIFYLYTLMCLGSLFFLITFLMKTITALFDLEE